MYVINLTHYLDAKGAIAPERGPARKMADFLSAVVAHASDFDRSDNEPGPVCFKCRKRDHRVVDTAFLRRHNAGALVTVLLELAKDHEGGDELNDDAQRIGTRTRLSTAAQSAPLTQE